LSNISRALCNVPGIGLFLILLSGCAEPTADVSGSVSYKGNPVTSGSISFIMRGKGIGQDAPISSTGSYKMPAAMPVGNYLVCYVPPSPEPQDPAKVKGPPPAVKSDVPTKFQDVQTSKLSFEVRSGNNEIPIDLKD
jgi:hypothetical protein